MKTNLRAVTCECGNRIAAGQGYWTGHRFICPTCLTNTTAQGTYKEETKAAPEAVVVAKEIEPWEPEPIAEFAKKMEAKAPHTKGGKKILEAAALKAAEDWAFDSSVCITKAVELKVKTLTSSRDGYKVAVEGSRRAAIEDFQKIGARAEATKLAYSKKLEVMPSEAPLWEFHWTVTGTF